MSRPGIKVRIMLRPPVRPRLADLSFLLVAAANVVGRQAPAGEHRLWMSS
jgi:hypothetical protein